MSFSTLRPPITWLPRRQSWTGLKNGQTKARILLKSIRTYCGLADISRCFVGKRTIYLHQSGASVLSDTSSGNNVNNEVYSDKTAAQIDTLADTAPHRKIDLGMRLD